MLCVSCRFVFRMYLNGGGGGVKGERKSRCIVGFLLLAHDPKIREQAIRDGILSPLLRAVTTRDGAS